MSAHQTPGSDPQPAPSGPIAGRPAATPERPRIGPPPGGERRGVVAVGRREGKFLAIRRGRQVAAPGKVCFPGGHVEPGEEEHAAVVRECREELRLDVTAIACVWRSVTRWGTPLAWWLVDLPSDDRPDPCPVEVAEVLWLTHDELLAHPDLLDGNREFLRRGVEEGHFGL